jgi:Fe-S oxidoreductase
MTIARVFPRRTAMTPTDALAFVDCQPPLLLPLEVDEVHISVAFTWDMEKAEWLERAWRAVGVPVRMGGPAKSEPGGEFVPGLYVKQGVTITSRGCPNRCWFCSVPKREGFKLRELPIRDGWNVIDDNLLACSEAHIRAVFDMLKRQPERPVFTGGLEAKILQPWHVELLRKVKAKRMYFAYDTKDDYEPLMEAGKLLRAGGIRFASHAAACYVLIGYPGDTFIAAENRLNETIWAGFQPYAMLYRDETGQSDPQWRKFQREWLRPEIVGTKMREVAEDFIEA